MAALLSKVRVVETGVLIGVDLLGQLLGDQGADIVKIERPGVGDYIRDIGAKFSEHHSAFHIVLNRNKRSIECDLTTTQGQEIVHELIQRADVFITGNIGDTNRALGVDYETLRKVNSRLVYCQITGFGAEGPYAGVPVHGWMMDALGAGAPPLALNGDGFVVPTGEAVPSTGGWILGGLYGAFAVASALLRTRETGEGCYIDIAGADAAVAVKYRYLLPLLNAEKIDSGTLISEGTPAKYTYYETKDGKFVMLGAIEEKFWRKWCEAVERPDLAGQHRTDLAVDYAIEDSTLRLEIQSIFSSKTQAEWMQIAAAYDIPIGPGLYLDEITDDPHLTQRQVLVEEQNPTVGAVQTMGNPIRVRGEKFLIRSAPELGEHTDEVLEELGYGSASRAELRDSRVVG